MFNRNVSTLTLALLAGVMCISAAAAHAAETSHPSAATPAGWNAVKSTDGTIYFFPPRQKSANTYMAVFPALTARGALPQTVSTVWHALIGNERLVDEKTSLVRSADGAPAYEVLVATIDGAGQGVYRLFVVKQYGTHLAVGELRFSDVELIKEIGRPAVASLLAMSLQH